MITRSAEARLHLPPDQLKPRPESQVVRSLYDCPEIPVGPTGVSCRVVVATHPAGNKKSPVGVTRAGIGYGTLFHQPAPTLGSPPPMSSNLTCTPPPLRV